MGSVKKVRKTLIINNLYELKLIVKNTLERTEKRNSINRKKLKRPTTAAGGLMELTFRVGECLLFHRAKILTNIIKH